MDHARTTARRDQVAAWMQRRFVELAPSDLLSEARDVMRMARLRHLLVVDRGILVGLVSYRDLLEAGLSDADPRNEPRAELAADARIEELMISVPVTVTPTTPLREAAACMLRFHLGCLPVIDGGSAAPRALGIVTESDLLRAAYASGVRPG